MIKKKAAYQKIDNNEPVVLNFRYVSDDLLMLINAIVAKFLAKHDLLFLLHSFLTIAREIIVNSLKANAKRVFFSERGLDINNPADYSRGIALFREQIVGDFELIRNAIISSEYGISVRFSSDEKGLSFRVKNNSAILPVERQRINKRIASAVMRAEFSEIYGEIEDDTEGAGLGIALIIMFLKSMGINPETFSIKSDSKLTLTEITIPFELKPVEIVTLVKNRILAEVKGLPTFPENVMELLNMCASPDAQINSITEKIRNDPSIASDVIKLANSAGFITGNRIEDIKQAVMKIGLKNVRAILLASNARKIMESRYSRFEEIWEHCNRTAFYAREIAQMYKLKNTPDNAFLAGLLHDLGQVILLAVDMDSVRKIADLVHDRNIVTSTVMEEISIGISHSEIGSLLSGKWNFPDFLTESIKYHHAPQSVQEEYRDVTFCVYLANVLCGVEKRKYYYYYLEDAVLEKFGISSEQQLLELHESLQKSYESFEKSR